MNIMGYEWGWDNARALIGIAMIYGLAWAWSEKRNLFPWKVVLGATVLQFAFALIVSGIFALANLDFDWQVRPKASVLFGARNLFDRNIELVEGYPEPGRVVFLTTQMKF